MSIMTSTQIRSDLLLHQSNPGFESFMPGCTDLSHSGEEASWEMKIHIQLFLSTNMNKSKIKISTHSNFPTSKLQLTRNAF